MIYPLVRELAATGALVRVPVVVTCRVLKIAKQPYYRWLKDPVSARDWDDAHLIDAAREADEEDATFGYRLIALGGDEHFRGSAQHHPHHSDP